MKIVIEEHTNHTIGGAKVHYRVRYKLKWYSFWRYKMYYYAHSDPDIKEFSCLSEAKKVAQDLRTEYSKPRDTIHLLDEDGKYLIRYSGG